MSKRKSLLLSSLSILAISLGASSGLIFSADARENRDAPSPVTAITAEELNKDLHEIDLNTSRIEQIRGWCPPMAQSITIGSNGRVGSGAQRRKKAISAATGLVGGLLGGGGGGGSSSRSSGPRTVRCKIKQKNMTVFSDPDLGVELQVGARRNGDNVEVFHRIKKSPDKGTFQTSYMTRSDNISTAPIELGICDLYGEFKLTVSWTKDTYVNGQHVDHQEGGWSEIGKFKIPGTLSSDAAPDGYWRMLGFSNASAGARQIKTVYPIAKNSINDVPVAITIHVTTPSQDPVVTVPFTVMMQETGDGFTFNEPPADCYDPSNEIYVNNDFGGGAAPLGNNFGQNIADPIQGDIVPIDIVGPDGSIIGTVDIDPTQLDFTPTPPPAEQEPWAKFFDEMREAAISSGFAADQTGQVPETSQNAQTNLAIKTTEGKEREVRDKIAREFSDMQADVASDISAYLDAANTYQTKYNLVASESTELQNLIQYWSEAQEDYESADFQFAAANLGITGVKLGFKGVKWLTKSRTVADDAVKAADEAATAVDDVAEGGTALDETQAFDEVISVADDEAAAAKAAWEAELAEATADLEKAKADNLDEGVIAIYQDAVDSLQRTGPQIVKIDPELVGVPLTAKHLDPDLMKAAEESGVDVSQIIAKFGLKNTAEAKELYKVEWEIMRATASARGWHSIPHELSLIITQSLLQARQTLAGVGQGVREKNIETLASLRAMITSWGMSFDDWLRTIASEVEAGVHIGDKYVMNEIVLHFDDADIAIINAIIDSGGDMKKLRSLVSEIEQASLNGLARGLDDDSILGISTALDFYSVTGGLAETTSVGLDAATGPDSFGGTSPISAGFGDPREATPGADQGETRGQNAENVLYGTGELGKIQLAEFIDAFGVTGDSTATAQTGALGHTWDFVSSAPGEIWNLISEPLTTTAKHYYTYEAIEIYDNLITEHGMTMTDMAVAYSESLSALSRLAERLSNPDLLGEQSFLAQQAIDQLIAIQAEYQATLDNASDEWKAVHGDDIKAKMTKIDIAMDDLQESIEDLKEIQLRVAQMYDWLQALRVDENGNLKPASELFNPVAFVRITAANLFLKALAADAFGLTDGPAVQFTQRQPTKEETRERSERHQQAIDERNARIDSLPEDYEIEGLDELLEEYELQDRQMQPDGQ